MSDPTRRFARSTRWALAGAVVLALSGCSIVPERLTAEQIEERVRRDRDAMYADQEVLTEPLTFSGALARALKYNLDYRLKLMEIALSQGLFDVSRVDLLPRVVADAGYRSRSNDSGGTSIGIEDRLVSLRPSTAEARALSTSRAEFSWNVLDFGISYYRAKQAADEVSIAEERRRKVLQNIVQDVRSAYWRAAAAQRLSGEADALLVKIRSAIERSRDAERAGVLPPVQALAYQRALLDAMTLVNLRRQEMEFARRELAALMNVRPGIEVRIADVAEPPLLAVPVDMPALERMALTRRPELLEEDYRARITQSEARRQLASLFPNLNIFAGASYNSNPYLYNNAWSDAGASVSINLMRLTGLPTMRRANEARAQTDSARRMALSMAVITQVRVSVERYRLTTLDHDLARESTQVDQRLSAISRASAASRLESELEALRTESRALVSRYQQATAYAAAQAAFGRVMNSLGIDLLPGEVRSAELPDLQRAIETSLTAGEREAFRIGVAEVPVQRPVRVAIEGLGGQEDEATVRESVERVLARSQVGVRTADDAFRLLLAFTSPPAGGGRAAWRIEVADAAGKPVFGSDYTSVLPATSDAKTISAFAEAAVLSVMARLREALGARGVGR
ncbi:MAG: TolC family protein [Rhodocyclaceae bacterium]|nr:TolC family protein [Rhodocyclaceae bacterium]MCA3092037.1 TolC family protein [Rhodocyclaceae bacterium]MCA3095839.1 TolC family protein [Rhodocyclaceae bacterium]MCA3096445.1 TolC family protein [Rhodocyclaceae bacterium]MCA3103375.1 TolC family protein [Rhodocyclaceae bacterium]